MLDGPYAQYNESETTLRDHLAQDRTVLSNERTLLAHVRTSLTFAILGVTLVKFVGSPPFEVMGWLSIIVGIMVTARGIHQYNRVRSYFYKRAVEANKDFFGLSAISDTFRSFIR